MQFTVRENVFEEFDIISSLSKQTKKDVTQESSFLSHVEEGCNVTVTSEVTVTLPHTFYS